MMPVPPVSSLSAAAAPDLERDHAPQPGPAQVVRRQEVFRSAYGALTVTVQGTDFNLVFANGDQVLARHLAGNGLSLDLGVYSRSEVTTRYASGLQSFAMADLRSGSVAALLALTGGFHTDGGVDFSGELGGQVHFAVTPTAGGNAAPAGSADMAAYLLSNVHGTRFSPSTYALFFGDLDDLHIERDSVDVAVQLVSVVPLPGVAGAALVGLAGVAGLRRRPVSPVR